MADGALALPDDHAAHDEELISRLAAGDATAAEVELGQRLIAACHACALVTEDMRALAAATRSLRLNGTASPPPAPRDFRLSADDARRLRRGGYSRLPFLRSWPAVGAMRGLGGALATLGVIGILVGGGLQGMLGGAASGAPGAAAERNLGAATFGPLAPADAAGSTGEPTGALGLGQKMSTSSPPSAESALKSSTTPTEPFPLAGISVIALTIGIGMLLLATWRRVPSRTRRN